MAVFRSRFVFHLRLYIEGEAFVHNIYERLTNNRMEIWALRQARKRMEEDGISLDYKVD